MKIAKLLSFMAIAASLTMVSCAEIPETEDEGKDDVETPVDPEGGDKEEPEEPEPSEKPSVRLKDSRMDAKDIFVNISEDPTYSAGLVVELSEVLEDDVTAEIVVDTDYVDQYNINNDTDYDSFPADKVTLVSGSALSVPAGETNSNEIEISFTTDFEWTDYDKEYLLTFCIENSSDNVDVPISSKRVNYIISKRDPDKVKQVLYFEVNDVNPLNALEYKLEDGRLFFDAVILFAGNIKWEPEVGRVMFGGYEERNANIDALLEESETYIQPLREAGIKVYLCVLPHWTHAGLDNLSAYACEEFAREMAEIVKEYRLDGISLDDEYQQDQAILPEHEKWFSEFTGDGGPNYLCFQLKKQMQEIVPWPTEVSVYAWGPAGYQDVTYQGKTYNAGDFIDFHVADYMFGNGDSSTSPRYGIDKYGCSACSIELKERYNSPSAAQAREWKGNYGWCMWFAFNPVRGHDTCNLDWSMSRFNDVAMGLYDQKLQEPEGYYKKIGEGQYDPVRYEF